MIQRTTLPNLVNQKVSKINSLHQIKRYQINSQSKNQYNHSERLSSIQKGTKVNNNFKTQVSINSQNTTLQMKMQQHPDFFHTKVKSLRQNPIDQNTVASYFFKIQNGFKMLQNSDDLIKKLKQAQILQTQRYRTASIQHSKKKLQKKMILNSKNGTQPIDNLSEKKFQQAIKDSELFVIKKQKGNKKVKTEASQLTSLSSTLKNRKKQLTVNAKQAKYTFEHFNSGEIFTQLALINENKMLMEQNSNSYQPVQHKTAYNKMYSLKDNRNRQKISKKNQQQFIDEYNTFLRKNLPPSFGQNGNKSCIYQEYVLKRKLEEQKLIKSKLVQGNFLRTQPSLPQKQEFIFTNQIKAISAKKIQMDQAFFDKVNQDLIQQNKIQNYDNKFKPKISATTSKVVTKTNTKLNTLRQGQTFINKLKLKKLAKMQAQQKAKTINENRSAKSRTLSQKQHSSLSNYNENSLSQAEMNKFQQKSNLILGKNSQIDMKNPQIFTNNNKRQNELNQYQQQHLSNIDRLLCKEQSILRTQKEDLDCLQWMIAIKIQKRREL